jgi:hypothetical protein
LSNAACGGNAGLGQSDLGLIISRVDLDQKIAGLDALEIVHGDGKNFTGNPAAQPCHIGFDIGVVGGLDHRGADPSIPAQRCQRDKSERGQHRQQWNRETAP